MQRVTRDRLAVVFDRHLPPAAVVDPGERFLVETEDSRGGRTRTPETTTPAFLLEMRRRGYYGNPVTGPIYVNGAHPGDTLAVRIHAQTCDALGYQGYWPWLFHLEDFFSEPSTVLRRIQDGRVIINDKIQIPVRPMIGTIGTAPAVEAVLSAGAGRHGGNMDVEEIAAGSVLYLPVEVEGALLSLGDCHAIQSDGELNEVEMRSEVELSCEIVAGRPPGMGWPRVETPEVLVTIGLGSPLEEALRIALREMILWIESVTGMSKHDAYLLVGLAGHARPGQVQVPPYSMRCMMPTQYLTSARR